jgi:hypothetical protein
LAEERNWTFTEVTGIEMANIQNNDAQLIRACRSPIERGGQSGPVGYGKAVLNARKLVSRPATNRQDLHKYLGAGFLEKLHDEEFRYYRCPRCSYCL